MSNRGRATGGPWFDRRNEAPGFSLVELLITISLLAIVCAIAAPRISAGLDRARAKAATRYLAAQMGAARTQAVLRGAAVALRAHADDEGVAISLVVDGNGNGVRTREIDGGIDQPLSVPLRIEELFAGVVIGVPGATGRDAVRLSGTELLSFTPAGTATSGSLYVLGKDGSRFAIRILGVTARVRLEQYNDRTSAWMPWL
jgi:prepilin-type N-terminal cleavage/methylation domain-containing protein